MAYLRLIVNADDDNAFLRIINTPRRQIGTSTLETLSLYATEREISLFDASQEIGLQERLSEVAYKRVAEFSRWIQKLIFQCQQADPIAALNGMLDDIDYLGWLHQNASSPKVAEKRMENIQFLIESVRNIINKSVEANLTDTSTTTLKDAIAKLLLLDLLEQQEEADDGDKVQLMTLHAAKGLEFPHVFMLGIEEEILPHKNSIDDDNIEEERRLAYVGITRAQRSLTFTMAAKRKQFGEIQTTSPSRFIDELPQDDIEREGFGEANPEKNVATGSDTLSSLLGLFD
jgi:ATP-dependent DNA helicase Rep